MNNDCSSSFNPELIVLSTPITKEVNHNWIVEDINLIQGDPRKAINSSSFISISNIKISFQAKVKENSLLLSLKREAEVEENSMLLSFKRDRTNGTINIFTKNFSFSIVSLDFRGSQRTCDVPDQKVCDDMKGFEVPICNIAGNSLAINFKGFLMSEEARHLCVQKPVHCTYKPPEWIAQMLDETAFSDAQIKMVDKAFHVHKVVLASASRVFQAMLESDMQEKSGILEISDFDSSVIFDLLAFIYTGEAPNLEELAKELLLAADKYEIQSLGYSCMQHLGTNLTSENVVEYFVLADKLAQNNPLKNTCVKFIQNNWNSVSNSKSWRELEQSSKELALQAITSTDMQYSTSRINKDNISFQWAIENCKSLQNAKAKIKGPKIQAETYPYDYPLHFYLVFTESGIIVQFGDGEKIQNYQYLWICGYNVSVPNLSITSNNCSSKVISNGYFGTKLGPVKVSLENICFSSDETLTLHISAFLHDTMIYSQDTGIGCVEKPSGYKLNYKTALFSDFTITVVDENGTEEYQVHKAVLSSVSEVFLQMLKDETKCIELFDIEREVMSHILTYIYSGSFPNIKKNVTKLLLAADRFHLDNLVKDCVFKVQMGMTSSNVADYLCLCRQMTFCSKYLESACIDFIRNNSFSVYQSDSWKTLKESSIEFVLKVAKEVITVE